MQVLSPDAPVPPAVREPVIVDHRHDLRSFATELMFADGGVWRIADRDLFEHGHGRDLARGMAGLFAARPDLFRFVARCRPVRPRGEGG